jgi:hypothetical protein
MGENLGHEFESDAMLPVQYNEFVRGPSAREGEHKLMFAVLESAVESYLKHMTARSRTRRLLFSEARDWINAKNRFGLFSYHTLCESLGIDAKELSTALESRLQKSRRLDSNGPRIPLPRQTDNSARPSCFKRAKGELTAIKSESFDI